jgi:GntR family transcriptional regulator, transcriptional repressor for pyruvate dehydrogenase complex
MARLALAGGDPRFASPIRTVRTFETAIERIVEGIERSRLVTGDRLPNESELAVQLEISRPTLRQALRILERAGVVQVRRGSHGGIFLVTDIIPSEAILTYVELEEELVVDVLRARRIMETSMVRLAAAVAVADDYLHLERTVDLMRRNLGDRAAVVRIDAMFHRSIARACHSVSLQAAYTDVARNMTPIRDAYRGGAWDRQTLDVHSRQLQAMREGDQAALTAILDEHFRMLEAIFAESWNRTWDDVFGSIYQRLGYLA